MKTIELFAGSRSFSKVAESYGSEVFTTDYQDFENIDLVANVLDLSAKDFPYKPDFLWASPPCTTFSVASCQYHWTAPDKEGARFPKSDAAALGLLLKEEKEINAVELEKVLYKHLRENDLINFDDDLREDVDFDFLPKASD